MKSLVRILTLSLLAAVVASGAEIRVFAAASLSDALGKLAPRYKALTGDELVMNFGASGILARQIKEGAPVDVFISADEIRADQLEKDGLLEPGTRRTLVENSLVVIVPGGARFVPTDVKALASGDYGRVAIGDPDTVPAGNYAREVLRRLGIWTTLQGRIVPMENVRAVLSVVASGDADAGFVYRTDAAMSLSVRVACEVPAAVVPRIVYPMAVVKGAPQAAKARALVDFLAGPEAAKVLREYGFIAPVTVRR